MQDSIVLDYRFVHVEIVAGDLLRNLYSKFGKIRTRKKRRFGTHLETKLWADMLLDLIFYSISFTATPR